MSKTLCADDGLWAITFQPTNSKVHVTYAKTTRRRSPLSEAKLERANKKMTSEAVPASDLGLTLPCTIYTFMNFNSTVVGLEMRFKSNLMQRASRLKSPSSVNAAASESSSQFPHSSLGFHSRVK